MASWHRSKLNNDTNLGSRNIIIGIDNHNRSHFGDEEIRIRRENPVKTGSE